MNGIPDLSATMWPYHQWKWGRKSGQGNQFQCTSLRMGDNEHDVWFLTSVSYSWKAYIFKNARLSSGSSVFSHSTLNIIILSSACLSLCFYLPLTPIVLLHSFQLSFLLCPLSFLASPSSLFSLLLQSLWNCKAAGWRLLWQRNLAQIRITSEHSCIPFSI